MPSSTLFTAAEYAALADKQGWCIFTTTPLGKDWTFEAVEEQARGKRFPDGSGLLGWTGPAVRRRLDARDAGVDQPRLFPPGNHLDRIAQRLGRRHRPGRRLSRVLRRARPGRRGAGRGQRRSRSGRTTPS